MVEYPGSLLRELKYRKMDNYSLWLLYFLIGLDAVLLGVSIHVCNNLKQNQFSFF